MSVQFGRWNFDGKAADRDFLQRAAGLTAKYGPDGEGSTFHGPVGMFFQPLHATKESRHAHQPITNLTGMVLTWDGRLDNREELIHFLQLSAGSSQTDAGIVLAAYEHWDKACFPKLLGDWALALWDPFKQSLLLAKDFVGIRQLFYSLETSRITWSTVLDPLLCLAGHTFQINEEYIAGYLSTYPGTHLTPFVGVSAVPAGTFVEVTRNRVNTHTYWEFDPAKKICYRTDAEYEEHFRSVFAQAARRRLRSSSPVAAELSGGMDSASIVCMADAIIAEGGAECPRLDTISYYDDQEPNWNERPYFTLVEQKRGRAGFHIDVGASEGYLQQPEQDDLFALPGYDQLTITWERKCSDHLQASGSRVLLSGIGGDEFLGGVPTPIPELQNLFARLHWARMARQLSKWSIQKRRPWTHLWFETVEEFLPQAVRRSYKRPTIAPWLSRSLMIKQHTTLWADTQRTRLMGALPSFQANIRTLEHLRRQLNALVLSPMVCYRFSYPYLDRDLLSFLFSIPREQLVRPGQRRSLVRRALASVVPAEVFARRRKAYVVRRPLARIESSFPIIENVLKSPLVVSHGFIDGHAVADALSAAKHGSMEHLIPLLSALKVELWLQALTHRNLISSSVGQEEAFADRRVCEKAALVT
jgi:asparagine synthase (glutamine-hydrolysing)